MDALDAVNTGLTVLSMAAAVFAWWHANSSEKSRQAAEQARDTTLRMLDAAKRQAEGIESIARTLAPEPLIIEWVTRGRLILRNTTPDGVTITEVINRGEFVHMPLKDGTTIKGKQGEEIIVLGNVRLPSNLNLRIAGEPEPVMIPLIGRPPAR